VAAFQFFYSHPLQFMRLLKFLSLLLTGLTLQADAQEATHSVSSTPSQFPHLTLRVEYYRFISREPNLGIEWRKGFSHSHEIRIGYLYSQPINRYLHERTVFTSTMAIYQGPSIGYQHRFWWFKKNSERYINTGIILRYLHYTDETMWMGGWAGASDINTLYLSQWRSDMVLSAAFCGNANPLDAVHIEFTIGAVIGHQYTRVSDCRFCDPTRGEAYFESQTKAAGNQLYPQDGFFIRPWIRFTFSVPYYLIKAERKAFRN
jgi:hypothetical protein